VQPGPSPTIELSRGRGVTVRTGCMPHATRRWLGRCALVALVAACSGDPRPSTSFQTRGKGGASGVSGSPASDAGEPDEGTGGTQTGGRASSTNSGGSGGATGGSAPKGGASGSGGAATGGKASTGGTGGKASNTGGKASNTGGKASTGGKAGTGGGANQGGMPNTGSAGEAGASGNPEPPPTGDFFGDSRCTDDFLLCEDFEGTSLDTDKWSTMGSAPEFDTTRAARGARSGHFHTTNNGLMLIRNASIFPVPDNRYYGRLFVYFDALPSDPQWAHWSLVGAQGEEEAEIRVGGQFDGEINRFGVGTDHGPTGDWTRLDEDSDEPVPVREWLCIEWLHDGSTDETQFWVNEEERGSLHTTADDHGGEETEQYLLPDFESAWVGYWQYATGVTPNQFDVWIDEVVFDDERVGCSD
jgi:hypothetical protein